MSHVTHTKPRDGHECMFLVLYTEAYCTYEWVTLHTQNHVTVAHVCFLCYLTAAYCAYEWVTLHTGVSACHRDSDILQMSRLECSRLKKCGHKRMSPVKYEWVMLHMWMSHVAYVNESYRTYKWVVFHISKSRFTHTRPFDCLKYVLPVLIEWVMSHIWMSHVTHTQNHVTVTNVCHLCCMGESCCTYERVTSYTQK